MHKSAILSVSLLVLLLAACREDTRPPPVVERPAAHQAEQKAGQKTEQESEQETEREVGSSPQPKVAETETATAEAEIKGVEPEAGADVGTVAGSGLKSIPKTQKGVIMSQGTVRYINLEGGFWGIITDKGQKILPRNLPKEYRIDGLRLSFETEEIKGMMTIQQWGVLSNISNIKVIGRVGSESSDLRI